MASLDYAHRRLVNAFGPERVAAGELERMAYSHDFAAWRKAALLQWRMYPDFVVLPQTTEEICRLIKLSDETGLQITPRGSGSGSVGGSVPNRGGVLVDMRRMNHIVGLDADALTVTVEAGATWQDVARYAETRGLTLPLIPSGGPASTIGGAINSGSLCFGAYRHGPLLDHVLGLEVVMPDGTILWTTSTGNGGAFSDIKALFFGAEGTLGIVTKAVLRLAPRPEATLPVGFAFPDVRAAVRFLQAVADSGTSPYHVMLLDRNHLTFERAARPDSPDPADVVVAVLSGPKDEVAEQEKILEGIGGPTGGTPLAEDVAKTLWDRRYVIYSVRRVSRGVLPSHNLVPVARLADGVAAATAIFRSLHLQGAITASLASPATVALSPYVLMDDTSPMGGTTLSFAKKMGDRVFRLGGHPMGLGLFLSFNLRQMHGHATLAVGAVKEVIDPAKKVNGGKTIECWSKFTWPFIRVIPPGAMRFGLELAALLRRIKPFADKFVPMGREGA